MNPNLLRVTQRIVERSQQTREAYLARIEQAKTATVHRSQLACGNLAHGFAACQPEDKASLKSMLRNNIAIITSYNDMLSAHQPYEHYPQIIRQALHSVNAVGQVAGGVPVLMRELLNAGLLHEDVNTVAGFGLKRYTLEPWLNNGELDWREGAERSLDNDVIASFDKPFSPHGGTKVLSGNLGRAVMKTSAVPVENQIIEAPAMVFESQHDVLPAFDAGLLDRDCVVVVRHQGPKANGMPELHKLMPPLGVLLDRRFKIALVTDGRLSGASGKVPSAIHVTPEAYDGGLLAKVRDGDIIRVNGQTGELTLLVDEAELAARQPHIPDLSASRVGTGRELFGALREKLSGAEQGATCITF
ncbi:hypothetical protein F8V34_03165 [Salmonella enterica]|nr:hypothetical protein [Salmonella enterica]